MRLPPQDQGGNNGNDNPDKEYGEKHDAKLDQGIGKHGLFQ
jgi:hypothetical protein